MLLAEDCQLNDGELSERDSLSDLLCDSLESESEPLESDADDSLPDDTLADVDSELLSDGALADTLVSVWDESLDEPDPLDCEPDDSLDDASESELELERLGRLTEVLESLDSLVDDSLD